MARTLVSTVHVSAEWVLNGERPHADPWGELTVEAVLTTPGGASCRIPAFWAGGDEWRVRVSVAEPGRCILRSVCSDPADPGLHGCDAVLDVRPAGVEANPLFRHGPVQADAASPRLVHHDGTPFFWLGDTWWMLMSDRVRWPDGFQALAADRAGRGFTVVQTVLGFPGDLATDDPRAGNEGGLPWEPGLARINPAYFDACDARLNWLVRNGIVPCILGSWGYHLLTLGEARMASHWRYLVARYGAWPVVWCLAGEGAMPYYLSADPAADSARLRAAWSRLAVFVRDLDPYHRPLTLHPRRASWDDLEDASPLTLHMLQPGHMPNALQVGVSLIEAARARFPHLPVVNAEPPYEGHMGANGADVQRYAFWSSLLSGAAGFTYGAAGIFQANDRDRPTGNRPDGGAYDAVTWDEALGFPGARQLAWGKGLLLDLPWQRFQPHPEWLEVSLRWGSDAYQPPFRTYAAGVPGECRVHYIPRRYWHWDGPRLRDLEPGVRYRATYVDPARGTSTDLGEVGGDAAGCWQAPVTPYLMDWLLVLHQAKSVPGECRREAVT